MREPASPGWAEEQTPTPFLYHKYRDSETVIFQAYWGVHMAGKKFQGR